MNNENEEVIKEKPKWKAWLQWSLKLIFTTTALIFVFRKVDFDAIQNALEQAKWGYFVLAVAIFLTSKIIGAFRLNHFYKACNVQLKSLENIKLYLLGMFYNLFLPGGIGGDGYKIYLLRQNHEVKVKKLLSATFLDRVSGVAMLLMLALIMTSMSSVPQLFPYFRVVLICGALLAVPALYIFIKVFFQSFITPFWPTTVLSIVVQVGQVLAAFAILLALGIDQAFMDYLSLFMVSSIAFFLPISIGGAGAREVVFLYGARYLDISESLGVTFALLFFAATALSALTGLFMAPAKILTSQKQTG